MPATLHHPVLAFETFSPAVGTPIALGTALSSTFHKKGLEPESLDSPNPVANEDIVDHISNVFEDWCSPTEWMCATPNSAQLIDTDRYSSKSHTTPTPYDSQNITSKMLYMPHNARSPSPRLHSSPDPTPTRSPSSKNLSELLSWDSSHLGQEAASTELLLSPAIRVSSIEAISVPPALPQSESLNVAVAGNEYRCPLPGCGIHFTQSQVLNRHMKDKHGEKGSCTLCSSFKWSLGRPYLYRRHLRVKHPGLTFAEDRSGGARRAQVSRARQCKVQKTRVTSRGLVAINLNAASVLSLT